MELDSLSLHHQLQGPEAEHQLDQQEQPQDDVDSPLQRENDGVNIGHEVHGEGDLEKSQYPESSEFGNLHGMSSHNLDPE